MKKTLKITLLFSSLLFLVGCSSTPSESESEEPYIDENDITYVNYIEEPSYEVHDITDLMAVCDYNAFYKNESFDVTIASDYTYSSPQGEIYNEICYLYWNSELINGVMGITGEDNGDSTWTISYTFYHNAYVDTAQQYSVMTDLSYRPIEQTRSADYDDFATEDESKPVADVYSTQQLWYAAEHGYRINCIEDSPAEYYYDLAKDVLREIIDDEMDDYDKVSAIYDYIEHRATYSYKATNIPDASDPTNYPDEYAATYKAYFIEGFFDNDSVVCDGFAKVYTLLGSMEGINIVRGSGTSDTSYTTKEVAGHAYCFVEIDGEYYLSCPTWGQNTYTTGVNFNHYYFLTIESSISPYLCTYWEDLTYATSSSNNRWFQEHYVEYEGEQIACYLTSTDQITTLAEYLGTITESHVCLDVKCSTKTLASSLTNQLNILNVHYAYSSDGLEYIIFN